MIDETLAAPEAPKPAAVAPEAVARPAVAPVIAAAAPVEPLPVLAPTLATVTTLAEFAAAITAETQGGLVRWFRGTRAEKHRLEPGLYRHPTIKGPNELIELEWQLLASFKQQAPPFVGQLPETDLELLFLMQHYRVPTRLLDWSENPFVALFFALENCREELAGEERDAAVWLLDPVAMNTIATTGQEGEATILGAFADELDGYKPRREGKSLNRLLPLAIFGIHNSPRIVAQRGTFTIFGKDTTPIESNDKISGANGCAKKIVIAGAHKKTVFTDLFGVGISDSVVYPDLDGLGRELRNRRGF